MEASESYVGIVCTFFAVGALIGGTVTAIVLILWQDK